jgi:cytochrome c biogenesis protein CcmG, thiol:disulfide interchange protein DsbE
MVAEPARQPSPSEAQAQPPAPRASLPLRALQVLALALVAGLLALLVWRVIDAGRGTQLVSEVRAGKKPLAPAFKLPVLWRHAETWPVDLRAALRDGQLGLGELHGHPIVLNFWASWRVPCGKEAPLFRDSARAHRGQVAFLGIDINDFKGDARRFLRKHKVNYVSVRNGNGSLQARHGLTGLPETYYLNAAGRIVGHSPGEVSREELAQGIRQAIGATP